MTCFGLIRSCQLNSIHCWQRCLLNRASEDHNDVWSKVKLSRKYFLPDLNSWLQRLNGRPPSPRAVLFAKGVRRIKHDALVIKRRVSSVVVLCGLFVEVCFTLRSHVVEEDRDEKISVRSGLLVNGTFNRLFNQIFKLKIKPSEWRVSWMTFPTARHSADPRLTTCPRPNLSRPTPEKQPLPWEGVKIRWLPEWPSSTFLWRKTVISFQLFFWR